MGAAIGVGLSRALEVALQGKGGAAGAAARAIVQNALQLADQAVDLMPRGPWLKRL